MGKERPPPQSERRGGDSYRPRFSGPSDTYRPTQAPRGINYRPDQVGRGDTYRPNGSSRQLRRNDSPRRNESSHLPPVRSAVTKTKHERKNNPSTRIHSLKKQLQTQSLPGTVRQERERELAALLFEQEKTKVKADGRKNLQRYHFVRFMERQKSERRLKKLIKHRESCDDAKAKEELDRQIHATEVDLNYAKYAPLADRYIGLYPHASNDKPKKQKFGMDKLEFAVLDKHQQEEIRAAHENAANLMANAAGVKPPMWYEVEEAMEQGEKQLEALRDRVPRQLVKDLTVVGGRDDAQKRSASAKEIEEAAPDWLNDDGIIDAADLDSDQDDEMGDGGFFER